PARRRNPVHQPGAARGARAGRAILFKAPVGASRCIHQGRAALDLICRLLLLVAWVAASPAGAQEQFIVVASTTSTEQSGLFGHILPVFQKKTGIQARVVALGTGQALDLARRGDADVVFVHARAAEEKFLAEGHGVRRYDVMYNDFVLIGPKSDPARIAGGSDILDALRKIKA